eukprot:scpid18756/ scgid27275/ Putative deoxyribonuclease TATDN3
MIDGHCHISDVAFDHDREAVLQRASDAGVAAVVAVTESFADFDAVLGFAEGGPYGGGLVVAPCLGVHPVQSDAETGQQRSARLEDLENVLQAIRSNSARLVGIGEVGLDFQPRIASSSVEKDSQKAVLKAQVELAKELGLPLNVHSRSAGRPTIEFLKECNAKDVVLHAFDGRAAIVRSGVDAGYFFSVPPSIVRSEQTQKLVNVVPLNQLLLETDSPALGPEKQGRNEPCNLKISCEEIARIKGVSIEEVRKITMQNTLKLFSRLRTICPRL